MFMYYLARLCRIGATVTTLAILLSATLPGAALAQPQPPSAPGEAQLFAAHQGATNPGFAPGTCPAAGWGWHFVLRGTDTAFVTVAAQFATSGTITAFTAHPDAKHAYVYTAGPDTLLAAVATTNGGTQRVFNLSHVCAGSPPHPSATP